MAESLSLDYREYQRVYSVLYHLVVAVLIFIVMIEKNQLQLALLDVMKLMNDLRELAMQYLMLVVM